jgi:hypothetical protein
MSFLDLSGRFSPWPRFLCFAPQESIAQGKMSILRLRLIFPTLARDGPVGSRA